MANPTEVYPANATILALDGTTDANTGLQYVSKGTSPNSNPTLEVMFNRLLNRLNEILATVNQLRAVKVDDTHIGIFAGKYRLGGTPTSYAYAGEASIEITATDDTYYVYLTSGATATVVTDATGWPADEATYIPICEVTVTGSVIASIVDVRTRVMFWAQ